MLRYFRLIHGFVYACKFMFGLVVLKIIYKSDKQKKDKSTHSIYEQRLECVRRCLPHLGEVEQKKVDAKLRQIFFCEYEQVERDKEIVRCLKNYGWTPKFIEKKIDENSIENGDEKEDKNLSEMIDENVQDLIQVYDQSEKQTNMQINFITCIVFLSSLVAMLIVTIVGESGNVVILNKQFATDEWVKIVANFCVLVVFLLAVSPKWNYPVFINRFVKAFAQVISSPHAIVVLAFYIIDKFMDIPKVVVLIVISIYLLFLIGLSIERAGYKEECFSIILKVLKGIEDPLRIIIEFVTSMVLLFVLEFGKLHLGIGLGIVFLIIVLLVYFVSD